MTDAAYAHADRVTAAVVALALVVMVGLACAIGEYLHEQAQLYRLIRLAVGKGCV